MLEVCDSAGYLLLFRSLTDSFIFLIVIPKCYLLLLSVLRH